MPASEFFFALKFAALGPPDRLLSDVATAVCRHVGCEGTDIAELIDELDHVLASARERAVEVDVQFRAHAGSIELIVLSPDRELLRTKRALPSADVVNP